MKKTRIGSRTILGDTNHADKLCKCRGNSEDGKIIKILVENGFLDNLKTEEVCAKHP